MKVLHLVSGELESGAASGAYLLHEALLEKEIDSWILNNTQLADGFKNVETVADSVVNRSLAVSFQKLDNLHKIAYPRRPNTKFSCGFFGFDITKHPLYQKCDIVHLHWISNGFVDISKLKKIKKPIFWTLRDLWPMTGGCHYAMGCKKFKSKCGTCPQLDSNRTSDLSTFIQNYKSKYLDQNIHFIGLSKWITQQAKESHLLRSCRIQTIPNGIKIENFDPVDKRKARQAIGLELDKPILLIGAIDLNYPYKGPEYIPEVLKELGKSVQVLIFGKSIPNGIRDLKADYKYLGYLNQRELANAYSASDLYLTTSIEDAFQKTVAESMCCQTPVVSFATSGPSEIIDHKINGYKAEPYITDDLVEGIHFILSLSKDNYNEMCKSARAKVMRKYDIREVADQYIEYYKAVLS